MSTAVQPPGVDSAYAWRLAFLSMFCIGLGGGATYLPVVALKEIALELGVASAGPLTARGAVVRPRAAAVLAEVVKRPEEEVRRAAERVWERLYGAKLPDVREVSVHAHATWRH